ncbi:MAG: hypothetical protein U1E40_14135 [Amaricoccus sp.]
MSCALLWDKAHRAGLDATDPVASERGAPRSPPTHVQEPPTMAQSGKQRRFEIDVDRYQAMLDSTDLTPTQKEDLIRALWTMMMMAIDLGLSIQPAPNSNSE